MAKNTYDPVLVKQLKLQASKINWEISSWVPRDNAASVVRTILELAGEKELLDDSPTSKEERKAMVEAVLPVFKAGAAKNFQWGALEELEIAPKHETAVKPGTRED